MEKKLAVVALGGNALLRGYQIGTIKEQEKNAEDTLRNLMFLLKGGYDLIISHGNGPQVGNILMRNDAGEQVYNIAQMPLDVCVADSQGGIGYMLERVLRNLLNQYKIDREIVTLVTIVEVDIEDEAFKNPRKRVGKIYTKKEADKLTADKGWMFKEEIKEKLSGWRRVVPSPVPKRVLNSHVIESMARQGTIVIAVGGGGVPVYFDKHGNLQSAEAVIDKDSASSVLASKIGADEFYVLTDVPFVYLNYKKENQETKEFLNYSDTKKYLEQRMFGEGSMAPKIKSCLNFIEKGGSMAVITEATKLDNKNYGTKITKEYTK